MSFGTKAHSSDLQITVIAYKQRNIDYNHERSCFYGKK